MHSHDRLHDYTMKPSVGSITMISSPSSAHRVPVKTTVSTVPQLITVTIGILAVVLVAELLPSYNVVVRSFSPPLAFTVMGRNAVNEQHIRMLHQQPIQLTLNNDNEEYFNGENGDENTSSNSLINDEGNDSQDSQTTTTFEINDEVEEETLLRIAMKAKVPTTSLSSPADQTEQITIDDIVQKLCHYCQSYPFAAVLPVQPLHYFPLQTTTTTTTSSSKAPSVSSNSSSNIGSKGIVEIQFLRKKTLERGSLDGGIRFYYSIIPNDDDRNDDEESTQSSLQVPDTGSAVTIELIAKRNSYGQVIQKIMAEKIIVTNFIASFVKSNDSSIGKPIETIVPSPIDPKILAVQSIYHKWM